jgi:hypothetical protein
VKVLESAILTVPPLSCVGSTFGNWKENGLGIRPFGLTTSVALSEGGTWNSGGHFNVQIRKKEIITSWELVGRYKAGEMGYEQRPR